MAITAIIPLTSITSIEPALRLNRLNSIFPRDSVGPVVSGVPAEGRASLSFSDMLKGMIANINETDAQTKADSFNLAMGFTDIQDLHNIEINAIRADLALRTMTSVRNKVLEAYTEIMRITI